MPRASMNPDKARQGGGGVEPGNYQVTNAEYMALQTDYRPNQLYLVFDAQPLDKDGEPIRSADEVTVQFSFGEKSLESFHPGNGNDASDTDPADLGTSPGTNGNTIYCGGSEQFNRSCGALVFAESMVKAGFPKDVLDQCWAPNYNGLKFTLATLTPKECNERFGTRLNTRPIIDKETKQEVTITYKVMDRWLNPNYLTSGTPATASTKTAASGASGAPVAAAVKPSDPEDIAKEVLGKLATERAGEKKKIKTKQALVGHFTAVHAKERYDPKTLSVCQELVRNEDWLIDALGELGATHEDGVTTFPG